MKGWGNRLFFSVLMYISMEIIPMSKQLKKIHQNKMDLVAKWTAA
jgi:hypothetical protein